MINVDVSPQGNDIYLVRFSNPDESFENNKYIPIKGMDEVKRRMYFMNRKYIIDALESWLKQRKHASPYYRVPADHVIANLNEKRLSSFYTLCNYIEANAPIFEKLAPKPDSTCYSFYERKILPIIKFCSQDHS